MNPTVFCETETGFPPLVLPKPSATAQESEGNAAFTTSQTRSFFKAGQQVTQQRSGRQPMVRKDNSAEKKQPVIFQICCEAAAGEGGGVESDPGFGACSNLRRRLRGDPTAAGDGGSSHAPGRRAERRPSLQFPDSAEPGLLRAFAAPLPLSPAAGSPGRQDCGNRGSRRRRGVAPRPHPAWHTRWTSRTPA